MTNPAGLQDLAIRYQRDAYLAAAEAMDLRIALARMGRLPTADERLMSRRYDAAAQAAAERASNALQVLLLQGTAFERAA
jgi:hypothetical protein